MPNLTLELIDEAVRTLKPKVRHTPLEYSDKLSQMMGCPIWLKLEAMQLTGSFKVRGALFAAAQLTNEERAKGIATVSAGNHGKGVAYAAGQMQIPATIYVPKSVDLAKHRGIVAMGAEVVLSDFDGYDDTAAWAMDEIVLSGKCFIHPYEEAAVMAGNGGSLAAEVLADLPDAKNFLLPVGGGGLAAGFSFYTKQRVVGARNIGCELQACPSLYESLARGYAVTHFPSTETLGLALDGGVGHAAFAIMRECIDDCILIDEDELIAAWHWLLAEHQFLIEPSSAVTLAACLKSHVDSLVEPTVIVLSGRNVDVALIERLLMLARAQS